MQDYTNLSPERIRRAAFKARIITLLVLAGMFLGTHFPQFGPQSFSYHDKLCHVGAYLILTVCLLGSWELSAGILQPPHYFAVWLFGTLYGLFDEITQIPFGRQCDGLDWLSDIGGIVAGLILFCFARPLMVRLIGPGRAPALSANTP